VRVVKLILEKL